MRWVVLWAAACTSGPAPRAPAATPAPTAFPSGDVVAVSLATPRDGWCFVAVTSRGEAHSCDLPTRIWRSDDAGRTWQKVLDEGTLEVNGWWFSGEAGWLDAARPCAGLTPEPFATTDGGRTWSWAKGDRPEGPSDAAAEPACRVREEAAAWGLERRDGPAWAGVATLAKKWPASP